MRSDPQSQGSSAVGLETQHGRNVDGRAQGSRTLPLPVADNVCHLEITNQRDRMAEFAQCDQLRGAPLLAGDGVVTDCTDADVAIVPSAHMGTLQVDGAPDHNPAAGLDQEVVANALPAACEMGLLDLRCSGVV